jgi:hypothetical protein
VIEQPSKAQKAKDARRAERLAKALRENLKRRKAQARRRAEDSTVVTNGKTEKSEADSSTQP